MKDDHEWGTRDIGLAAAVRALGAEYDGADKNDPRKVEFFFKSPEDKSGFAEAIGEPLTFDFHLVEIQWMNDDLKVSARKYFTALRDLKSVIYSR